MPGEFNGVGKQIVQDLLELAELNGPVPRISLKIDLVVSVIIKDLPQAVYRPYRFDSLVGNTGEGFAVGIVPACA